MLPGTVQYQPSNVAFSPDFHTFSVRWNWCFLSYYLSLCAVSISNGAFIFRLVEEVKEAFSIVLEAEEIYMNTRCVIVEFVTINNFIFVLCSSRK